MTDAVTIVESFGPINREPNHKTVLCEKGCPLFVKQYPVGLQRVRYLHPLTIALTEFDNPLKKGKP